MASVAVARLRLKTPPNRAALATHRVTDALRLAPTGPERLLLVRRLALGRLPLAGRPSPWEARAAQVLADHSNRAVHGASAGPDAQSVWFRSTAEARALLLMQLLAGRRPTAWFWRLAVPEWESLTLEAWLPRWIALAAREPSEEVALARAVIAAAVAGRLAEVLAAVAGSTPRLAGGAAQAASGRFDPPLAAATALAEAPESSALRRAQATLARLPISARRTIEQALTAPRARSEQGLWLARVALLAGAPELGFAPEVLAASAVALVEDVRRRVEPQADAAEASRRLPPADPEAPRAEPRRSPDRLEDTAAPSPRPVADEAEAARPAPIDDAVEPLHAALSVEQTSRLAGLFLILRPLARMGFGEWLEARPELAADGFARGLLRAIARRMGAQPDDAALAAIAGEDDPAWANDLTAWRVGLDRWLWRRARIRLAEVVRRPGGLLLADDVLEVRFAPAAADVRLRRLALDLDPYWTPWLGLSVRYHYRDEPLT